MQSMKVINEAARGRTRATAIGLDPEMIVNLLRIYRCSHLERTHCSINTILDVIFPKKSPQANANAKLLDSM